MKKCKSIKRSLYQLVFLFILAIIFPCMLTGQDLKRTDTVLKNSYSVKIISASGSGYGYDIYDGHKIIIHQPTIPALPFNNGFVTKQDAKKVADLVIQKLRKSDIFPTITIEELKQLNVIPKK